MRILVLNGESQGLAAVRSALQAGAVEIVPALPLLLERRCRFAGWTFDRATRELLDARGWPVHLTSSEFDLLAAFVAEPGLPLSRGALTRALRGRDWSYFDRSIDTLVARLRKKLPGEPPLIRSVRGVGYVFCAAVARIAD